VRYVIKKQAQKRMLTSTLKHDTPPSRRTCALHVPIPLLSWSRINIIVNISAQRNCSEMILISFER